MSEDYGPMLLVRAMKVDILSCILRDWIIGWMITHKVGIWNYWLEMNTATYWW
jgi:hypothetical protein